MSFETWWKKWCAESKRYPSFGETFNAGAAEKEAEIAALKDEIASVREAYMSIERRLLVQASELRAERDKLREALTTLLNKLDEVDKDSRGVFQIAAIHGMPYQGANYSKEYAATRALLASAPKDEKTRKNP